MIGDLSRSSFSEWQRQKDCSKLKNSCRFIKKKKKRSVHVPARKERGKKTRSETEWL